jgi:pilus assembly protein Flp/PilA
LATLRAEQGATAVEYALMVALIAIVIVTAVTTLGLSVRSLFQTAAGMF